MFNSESTLQSGTWFTLASILISFEGCELDCPFPKFVNLLSDMMVTDIKTECQVKSPPAENDTTQVTSKSPVELRYA